MSIVKKILKNHETPVKVPRKVQDIIPFQEIFEDGLSYLGSNNFSMTYQFSDINYSTASRDQQENILLEYGDMLNEIDPSATAKVTIVCRKVHEDGFVAKHKHQLVGDELDPYRKEHNTYLDGIVNNASCTVHDKYITVTIKRKNPEEARSFFSRVAARIDSHLRSKTLGSKMTTLNANQRLQVLFDFVRPDDRGSFNFDLALAKKRGRGFKDYVSPDTYERVDAGCFKLGEHYYRSLYLKEYGSFIKDDFVSKLLDVNRSMMLSFDLIPVPTDAAVKEARNRLLGVEKNIANHSRRQVENKNFSGNVPYEFESQRNDIINFLDALTKNDEHMFLGVMTVCHSASSKEALDEDTGSLMDIARQGQCQLATLHWQQLEGLRTVLPVGVRCIDAVRSLTTEAASVLHPFRSLDIIDDEGIVYGSNTITKNVVAVNRKHLKNGNALVLGASGSAKSATVKLEILRTMLQDSDCSVIIIDPENEYKPLVEALAGEIITISPTTKNHLNAMEISANYGDDSDPIIMKTEFMLSFCEQILGRLTAEQKSIISRATEDTLSAYARKGFKGECPTLKEFYEVLGTYESPAAEYLRTSIELYAVGSFSMFGKKTNIETNKRLICYDISELGNHMRELGLLVIIDSIWSRLTANRKTKIATYIYVDEFYLLLQRQYTAEYFFALWKRIRKYFGFATGITQNTGDVLGTDMGRAMVANSEFLILLSQGNMECEVLQEVLDLSDADVKSIKDVPQCHGLIKVGPFFLPFDSTISQNTETFRLIDTSH